MEKVEPINSSQNYKVSHKLCFDLDEEVCRKSRLCSGGLQKVKNISRGLKNMAQMRRNGRYDLVLEAQVGIIEAL